MFLTSLLIWREVINHLVDILGCTRFRAEQILRHAIREGYRYR